MTINDYLQIKMKPAQIVLLVITSGVISYALNPAIGMIAISSVTAFITSSFVDYGVFSIEAFKKARYRFMKHYDFYNWKASVGYTDRSLVVFVKQDLGFELPDEFEGHPVRVTKV